MRGILVIDRSRVEIKVRVHFLLIHHDVLEVLRDLEELLVAVLLLTQLL